VELHNILFIPNCKAANTTSSDRGHLEFNYRFHIGQDLLVFRVEGNGRYWGKSDLKKRIITYIQAGIKESR